MTMMNIRGRFEEERSAIDEVLEFLQFPSLSPFFFLSFFFLSFLSNSLLSISISIVWQGEEKYTITVLENNTTKSPKISLKSKIGKIPGFKILSGENNLRGITSSPP